MILKRNKPATILYLEKDKLSLYNSSLAEVVSLPFAEGVIQDLSVLNQETLTTQLQGWLDQLKLPEGQVVMVLAASVYFRKDITLTAETKEQDPHKDPAVRLFLESIPFESYLSRVFPTPEGVPLGASQAPANGATEGAPLGAAQETAGVNNNHTPAVRVVATNKNLYGPIIDIFVKNKLSITQIAPVFVLGDQFEGQNFDLEMGKLAFKSRDLLRSSNLLSNNGANNGNRSKSKGNSLSIKKSEGPNNQKKGNRRLILLAVAFTSLLAILVWVVLSQQTT